MPTSPLEMGRGQTVPLGCSMGVSQRGMRPAGAVRPSWQKAPVGVVDVRENPAVRPLSAEAVEFSPTLGPQTGVTAGLVDMSSSAGLVAPAVVADLPVPAVPGVRFSAVVEVHASAVEVDEDTLVGQASEQRSEGHTDPRKVPGVVNEPMVGASVSGPLEHSVLKIDLDGGPMEGISVLKPLEHSVLDISLDGGPMEGASDLEPLEHSVLDVDLTGRPVDGNFGMEPLEHSVLDVNLDSRLMQDELDSGLLEHSVPDHATIGGAGEPIVVGAIGSAAPWFITGWAHDVEVVFMIGTGCQVTILSTSGSEGALQAATLSTSFSLGGLVSISGTRGLELSVVFFRIVL